MTGGSILQYNVVMAENSDEVYIDPQFFLPPNVLDIRYVETDNLVDEDESDDLTETESSTDTIIENSSGDVTWVDYTPEEHSELPIPDGLTFVSQTVKAAAGGGYLVDIVVDIPDLPGVETFDVAVTKV